MEGYANCSQNGIYRNQQVLDRIKYELKGIILHIGINIDSGHYVAIIDGFKYDNDVVKECEFEEAPSEQIYMLFYVKV